MSFINEAVRWSRTEYIHIKVQYVNLNFIMKRKIDFLSSGSK